MTAQQLKNSILQMAVQGKLVPQDPNDEPASVLLERIQVEKKQMIKDGKIKKEKNPSVIFRGDDNLPYEKVGNSEPVCIADEVPFEIPDSWEWVRLGNLFWHNTGKALNSSNKSGQLLEYITTSNLYWGSFELDNLKEMYFTESEIEKCTATKGDLLVCEGGDYGRAAIWNFDYDIRIQNHIHRLRAYLPLCVEYYFFVFYLYKHAGWISGKGIGIQGLSSNALHDLLFPLPPLEEQKRIVKRIYYFKPLTDRYSQTSGRLDALTSGFPAQLKNSILQQAVQGKLVPQDSADEPASVLLEKIRAEKKQMIKDGKIKRDKHESIIYRRDESFYEKVDGVERCIDDEIPFEIPESWEWVRLGSILSVSSGDGLTSREMNTFGKYPVYGGNGVAGFHSEYNIDHPTLVIGRVGYYCGSTHIAPSKSWVTDNAFITTFDEININMLWLKLFIDYTEPRKKASSTAQPVISGKLLYPLLMPLPPKSEQDRIVKKAEKTNIIIGNLQSYNKAI